MLLKHGSSCICTKPPSCYRVGREFNFPNNTEKLLEANYKSDQEKLQTANNSQVSFDIKIIIWVIFLEYKFISITVTMRAVFHTPSTFNKGNLAACLHNSSQISLGNSTGFSWAEVSKWGLSFWIWSLPLGKQTNKIKTNQPTKQTNPQNPNLPIFEIVLYCVA